MKIKCKTNVSSWTGAIFDELIPGRIYTLDSISENGLYTVVYVKEIPNRPFDRNCFEFNYESRATNG